MKIKGEKMKDIPAKEVVVFLWISPEIGYLKTTLDQVFNSTQVKK